MKNAIYFDMDGTIANLYGVENWLDYLVASDPYPYRAAKPMVNMSRLARLLNRLQAEGYHIGVVTWLCRGSDEKYDNAVTLAKAQWLDRHLPSVHWNEVKIVPYGTPKQTVVDVADGILFDDEAPNRENWTGTAYDVGNILEILKGLI